MQGGVLVAEYLIKSQNWLDKVTKSVNIEALMHKSVSFGAWVCLLPLAITVACIKFCFQFWLKVIRLTIAIFLPDFLQNYETVKHRFAQKASKTVEPYKKPAKKIAKRLTIIGVTLFSAISFSTFIYLLTYYAVIPTVIQKAPLDFYL